MADPGLAIAHRVNAERLVLAGWSRAILLQLAHPLIAAGVADHSSFRASPVASARRLHQTVRAMLGLTFGTETARQRVIDEIRAIHRRVRGSLRTDVGGWRAGTAYSAEDPALLLWVHATVLESAVLAYDAIVGDIDAADRDAYCREAASVAIALGARRADVPVDWSSLTGYIATMYASGALAVGPDARAVGGAVLRGRLSTLTGPVAWANRRLTAGWLPPAIREQYGLPWSDRHDRQFHRVQRVLRRMRAVMPPVVALWPEARR
jgi:uncharacterized protein (DUF2236 family)